MTVSSCPSCREPVVVPAGAPGAARVRCPLCRDEFLLSVVLDKLPPTLELLDAPAAESSGGISIGPVVGTKTPAFEFDESPAPTGPRPVSASPRPKRKEKSMVFEMVKIVLGGVVGIGLATLILWWGFHKDPLGLAPKVAAYASWAVPEKLRPPEKTSSNNDDKSKGESGASSLNGKNNGGGKVAANANNSKKFPGSDGVMPKAPIQPEVLEGDPFAAKEPTKPDDTLKLGPLPSIEPKPKEVKPKPPKPKTPTPPEDTTPKPKRFDIAKTLKQKSAADLAQAVQELRLANDDVDPALTAAVADLSLEKRREFANRFHNALAALGQVVILVDPTDAEVQSEAIKTMTLLNEIVKNPEKQKLLARLAEIWIANPDRAHSGLCVLGMVTDITPSGGLYEVKLELPTKAKTVVSVFAKDDPTKFYQPKARVMLMGAMVADPKENLLGYEGEAGEVGCVHFFIPLPPDPPAVDTPDPAKPVAPEKPEPAKPTGAEKPAPGEPEAKPAAKPADGEAK